MLGWCRNTLMLTKKSYETFPIYNLQSLPTDYYQEVLTPNSKHSHSVPLQVHTPMDTHTQPLMCV